MFYFAVQTLDESCVYGGVIISAFTEVEAQQFARNVPNMIGYVGCDNWREALKRVYLMRNNKQNAYGIIED